MTDGAEGFAGEKDPKELVRKILKIGSRNSFSASESRNGYQLMLRGKAYEKFPHVLDEKGVEFIVDEARAGCQDAEIVLRWLIVRFIKSGDPVPAVLRDCAGQLVLGKVISDKPGRLRPKPKFYFGRDSTIAWLVSVLVREYGFKPMRNAATEKHSACSLIADVATKLKIAGLSEKNVARIWVATPKTC
jgi:hypothetical protein